MLENARKFWNSLDRNVSVNQRELLLGAAVCTLAGVVAGMLLSPFRELSIDSNNGPIYQMPEPESTEDPDYKEA